MNQEQEYVKFWLSIKNKCDEIQEDYSKLSGNNKRRVENVKRELLRANTIFEIVKIVKSQTEG